MMELSTRTPSASRPVENDTKTLKWAPSVRDSTKSGRHISLSSPPYSRRHKKATEYHVFVDSSHKASTNMSHFLPRWLVSCGKRTINPNTEEYHVESWTSFHKTYSSESYRAAHSMTFSEIRRQQRRKAKPSLTERILRRFGGQRDKCVNCGAPHCDGGCSIYSTVSSKASSKKNKQSSSLFRRYMQK